MGQTAGHVQQSVQLVGMVGVIVVHLSPVKRALVLEAPLRAGKVRQTLLHRFAVHAQHIGGSSGGQRVGHVVPAGNVQLHVGVGLALRRYVEAAEAVDVDLILCKNLCNFLKTPWGVFYEDDVLFYHDVFPLFFLFFSYFFILA